MYPLHKNFMVVKWREPTIQFFLKNLKYKDPRNLEGEKKGFFGFIYSHYVQNRNMM